MIYGSVCSGIEAASVAWKPLCWSPSFFSEIDPFARSILSYHHGGTPLHGDFRTIKPGQYRTIDLLVGGTPCQSFSLAGFRGGLDDDRGNLALQFCLLARRLRPRWIVWENVPGVLSSSKGRDFGSILGAMAELGYGLAYRVLDAQYVRTRGYERAVPQRRRRVFVVGYLGDWRAAAAVLFDRESLCRNSPPRRHTGQNAAPTLAARTRGGGGLGTDFDCDGGLIVEPTEAFGGNRQSGPIDVAAVLYAHGGPHGRQDFESDTFLVQGQRVRRLTPLEAERLQGFPDNYTNIEVGRYPVRKVSTLRPADRWREAASGWSLMAADGARYKVLGNSMACNVMRWLGKRIDTVDKLKQWGG